PGPAVCPGRIGSQRDQGATEASIVTLRGPVRRSYSAAILLRQLFAATARSLSLNSICTNFSASANVAGATSGPTAGPVPNAGGAPGCCCSGACEKLGRAPAAANKPTDARFRN